MEIGFIRMVRIFLVVLGSAWIFAAVAFAQSEEENGAFLAAALEAADKDQWAVAFQHSSRINDPVANDIILWRKLRKGRGAWDEYTDFLARNSDWPGISGLRSRGEGAMPANHTPAEVIAYFKIQIPQTGVGAVRLAEALTALGQENAAHSEVIRVWREYSLTSSVQKTLLSRYKDILKDHHTVRLDMLLWRNLKKQSAAMYPLVSDGYVKLAKARLGLRARVKGVDGLINAVPEELQNDAGLVYERFNWRARKDRRLDALELLRERSTSAASLGQPERWAGRRRSYARRAMRDGDNALAYELASRHFLTSGSNYADLEWLSGFIALRKLNDPVQALKHFRDFRAAIATPISYGRAGYWIGRAFEAAGDKESAQIAYEFAAQYQTSFYGQLAAENAGVAPDKSLNGREKFPDWRQAEFINGTPMRAAILLHYAGETAMSERFFIQTAEYSDRTGLQQLADLAMELGKPSIALRVSKQAAKQGHVLPRTYFPLTDLAKFESDLAPEIAMSIARRESELNDVVVSPAGALGLMQIMPATARSVAKVLGVPYSKGRLTSDWKYNAALGSAYLAQQLKDFDGSYILAFAAYNAGPHRSRRWMEAFGDPRKNNVDQVDWIEHIPFRETRNYVMRVIESLHVYRARIKGRVQPLRIGKDLRKG